VTVDLVELERAEFEQLLDDPHAPDATPWDLLLHRHSAAWHHRNGRVFLEAIFATGAPGNVGGFSDAGVDGLIARALEAAVEPVQRALAAWRVVERAVLEHVAIVPLLFQAPAVPTRCGPRVSEALCLPALGYACDLGSVWLDERTPEERNGLGTGGRSANGGFDSADVERGLIAQQQIVGE
jgi:hypothetical protein